MGGTTRMLGYGYDVAGNRVTLTHPDGTWFGAWYDALGRQYYLHANNTLGMIYMYFAPHGGVSAVGRPGIVSWIGYDAVQRPSTLAIAAFSPTPTDVAFTYARNPAGQIATIGRDNDSYAWTGHYAVTRAYATNGLNQYSAAGTATFTYDANGNLTGDGSNTYTYDVENRLVGRSGGVALSYDPLGRLFEVSSTGGPTTRFLYDQDALVAEYVGGTLTRRYAHWEGADVPVATFEVAGGTGLGTLRNLFADHQGSIIVIGDGSGAITTINRYDEYGIPAATNTGRFQYTGQAWLAELGMYHYKARIYSPTLGRFLQTDPVGYQDQFNLYTYVGNDPVNHTDPTGRYICRGNRTQCAAVRLSLRRLEQASQSRNLSRADRAWARRIRATYGTEGRDNRVHVLFVSRQEMSDGGGGAAHTDFDPATKTSLVTLPANFATANEGMRDGLLATGHRLASRFSAEDQRGNMIADEGKHAYDQQRLGRQLYPREWHPRGQDFRSLVSRAFGSVSAQDLRDDVDRRFYGR